MEDLIKSLKTLLANNITMYLKAYGFHWNVEGKDFTQFHDFFGDIYGDLDGATDLIAENIRKLGGVAPFAIKTLDGLRTIKDVKTSTDPIQMCVDLSDANDMMLININEAFRLAVANNEQGIANFLADRDDMHKKWRWQLDATIKRSV